MKKRLLSVMLSAAALCGLTFAVAACGSGDEKGSVTVTLQANGGEFADSLTQYPLLREEGSTIGSVPVPKRDGYVFDGWATVESGSEMWTATTELFVDTTLYAKWAQKVTVTFDGNGGEFADGEIILRNDIKINTAAKQPEAPVREEYEFGGWYTATESGGKITLGTEYDFTKEVSADLTLYAKWNFGSAVQLATPSVSVKHEVFYWEEVEGAKSYDIVILDEEDEVKQSGNTNDTSFTFPSSLSGVNKVMVRAHGDGIECVNSAYCTVNFTARVLSSVSASVGLSDSLLEWKATNERYAEPEEYDLYIYTAPYDANSSPVYSEEGITTASFDMTEYQAGEHAVKIVAKKDGYASSESVITVYKNRLASPDAAISANDDFTEFEVSWKAVNCADTYIITVNNEEYTTKNLNYKIVRGEASNSSEIGISDTTEEIKISAFDSKHDHFISLPQEISLPQKTSLAKVSVTNDDNNAGSVKVSGSVYEHKQPPYTVYFNHVANLIYQGVSGGVRFSATNASYTVAEGEKIKYPEKTPITSYSFSNYLNGQSGFVSGKDENDNTVLYYYVFSGWYTDMRATVLYDFDAPVTQDVTLYAGWKKVKCVNTNCYNVDRLVVPVDASATSYGFDCRENYITCHTNSTYKLSYRNTSQGVNKITVYNLTQDRIVGTLTVDSTSGKSFSFSATKGDIIRITGENVSGNYDLNCSISNGSPVPIAKGTAQPASYTSVKSSSAAEIFAVKGKTVTLVATEKTAGTFLGWFDKDGNKVSDKLEFTVNITADAEYTAKWDTGSSN